MKILNFGSLNIDYVYSVNQFLKPGETIPCFKMETFCGGKGLNQSIAMARAGASVFHAGKTGNNGKILIDTLNESGVDTSFIKETNAPGGHAVIQVDGNGANGIIVYAGANHMLEENDIEEVFSHFRDSDVVLLQNETNCIGNIIQKAYDKKMRIAINPSPVTNDITDKMLRNADYLFINEIEGEAFSGEKDIEKMISSLRNKYPKTSVILTLGKNGAIFFNKDIILKHGIFNVPVVDTTAAGDTFTGFFLVAAIDGLPPGEALKRASAASSISVSRKGASPSIPTLQEVLEFIKMNSI